MEAELQGETRPIIKNRRGVLWCPFCDNSSVITGELTRCSNCYAAFTDEASEVIVPELPRRQRRTASDARDAEATVDEVVESEA